jgi:hydrogenase 3 maturation protease
LKSELKRILRPLDAERVVILGVGNILQGDDGVGSVVAQRLRGAGRNVFDGGTAPENFAEPIARVRPDTVIIIDAAYVNGVPGEIRLLSESDIKGGALMTHNSSLRLLTTFFRAHGIDSVRFIGIQPASNRLGEKLSPPVEHSARLLCEEIGSFLGL